MVSRASPCLRMPSSSVTKYSIWCPYTRLAVKAEAMCRVSSDFNWVTEATSIAME